MRKPVKRKGKPKPKPKPRAKMGRPTVWDNPAIESGLLALLADTGCSIRDASISVGIDYSTVKLRQQSDFDFSARVLKAVTERKISRLRLVSEASPWTAAAWELERKYPEEYGRFRGERETSPDEIAAMQSQADGDDEYARALRANPEARIRLDDALRALDVQRAAAALGKSASQAVASGPGVDRGAVLATRGASAPTQSVSDRGRRKAP